MKSSFLLFLALSLITISSGANNLASNPAVNASDVLIPVGNTGKKISLLDIFRTSVEKKSTKPDKRKIERIEKAMKPYKTALEKLNYDFEKFAKLTPKEYKKLTGEKLNIKKSIELRLIQKQIKKSMNPGGGEDKFPKWAYIVLVILGLGFIPIGIQSDWKGHDWWLNILLTLCFWLPGVIHGLIIMKKFY